MDKLKLIIKREFISKVRNKTFLVMTILSPLIVIGLGVLIGFLTKLNQDSIKTIAYLDESGYFLESDFQSSPSVLYENFSGDSFEIAKSKVESNEFYGLLYIPRKDSIVDVASNVQFYSKKSPNIIMVSTLESLVEGRLEEERMKQLGLDIKKLNNSKVSASIQLSDFLGEKSSKLINGMKIGIGMSAGYMIMMFIIIYGAMVMRSVIEEKTSRIIEVIISSVKPFELMMGKIVGTALAGLLQFTIWGILLVIIGVIASSIFGVEPVNLEGVNVPVEQSEVMKEVASNEAQLIFAEIMKLPLVTMFISFIIYFIGGYLLYSSIYAAIGAAVDNETDTQQFMLPVLIPLMLGVYVGFAAVISDPHGPISTVFSMIPFTSPIVMLMRIPFGVAWWEILISLVLLLATFLIIVWFAAKIYRIGILMYGKKPTYKELYKWMRY
ncbi:MAG: ABC transporter permease [Bacteroidetes bacterium MedPE-SWsnd-G1]|nr:MAG: ABC transporter permease [Bacteroidetes bacterium MedPE-SWsnd-G1]